jgi:hypothetical protein
LDSQALPVVGWRRSGERPYAGAVFLSTACRFPIAPFGYSFGRFGISGSIRDVQRDPARLIAREAVRGHSPADLVLEIDVSERGPLASRMQLSVASSTCCCEN